MKLMLGITIDIEPELSYGYGPPWIANAVSEPGHSVDVWRADRDVIDMNSAKY